MAAEGRLLTVPGRVVPPAALLAEGLRRFGCPARIVSDRWREGELRDGLAAAGFPAAELVTRGMGWKDGGADVREFQRACLQGTVVPVRSLLLRAAMAEARTVSDPTAPTAIADFDDFVAAFADRVDGLFSMTMADVGMVVGTQTYAFAEKTWQTATSYIGDRSAASYVRMAGGGLWTNARMPAAASDIQQAIAYKTGRPALRRAVVPNWGEMQITDPYTGAAKAETHVTAHVIVGDLVLVYPTCFAQTAFKLA